MFLEINKKRKKYNIKLIVHNKVGSILLLLLLLLFYLFFSNFQLSIF